MTLPAALAPLAQWRQFITYRTRPRAGAEGKLDKIPTDYRTGEPCDAHNPHFWTDYDTAWAAGYGNVAFVFTDLDPFWFIDIDDCLLPDNTWSPLAQEFLASLSGCACEISISGKGLHLFGTGNVPEHSCKAQGQWGTLEFYHTKRFVALSKLPEYTIGNCAKDCSEGLALLTQKYFSATTTALTPIAWSNEPIAEWNGPKDDQDLIRRACASKSAAGAFGARISFVDLWQANTDALARAFPVSDGRYYDASSADASLAQHLAFWTGKNCERIRCLMLQSALVREKWLREDYLPRTISNVVARQVEVCKDAPITGAAPTGAPAVVNGSTYLMPEQIATLFAGCVYISDDNEILIPGGHSFNQGRFDAMFGGYGYVINRNESKMARSAWDAFHNSRDIKFPHVHASEFAPDRKPGAIWKQGNRTYVNAYFPIDTPRKSGNPKRFLDHLAKILPLEQDRQIILAYMAAIVQFPGVKFKWCPLIQGTFGNGKSLLSSVVTEAVGREHCHTPRPKDLASQFNGWIANKIFINIEDIKVGEHQVEIAETLKPMITEDWQEVEFKNGNKTSMRICANFMLNSNFKDAVKKHRDDRRLAIFYCAQQSYQDIVKDGMGGNYFPDLYDWLRREGYAIVNEFLRTYPIPPHLNPAGECHRSPLTSSTEEAILESADRLEQEILEAIAQDRVGFRKGWVSMHFLDLLIKDSGLDKQYPRNRRRESLLALGYVSHPALGKYGQTLNPVSPDGCRPRLYIKSGHPASQADPAGACRQYTEDQKPAIVSPTNPI